MNRTEDCSLYLVEKTVKARAEGMHILIQERIGVTDDDSIYYMGVSGFALILICT